MLVVAGVPLLVLANKQDVPAALAVPEVERRLGLQELGAGTPRCVQGCSARDGLGLHQGLRSLYDMILKRRRLQRLGRSKR
uniref:Uncharacterized protein n=1 Tax=Apteryx owenii TaxID=8824 RepID=A0A8B9PFB2_APTOW